MTKGKAITPAMKVDCLLDRVIGWYGALPCSVCKLPLLPGQRIQFDHVHATTAQGPHEYQNLRPIHYDCHKAKTKRDVQLNAKAKRIAKGGKRKGPGPKSAGFRKPPKGYISPLSKSARKKRLGRRAERSAA